TARQGYERGFKVMVGSDVCATDDPTMQEPELKVLRKGFARVLSAEEIIAELERRRSPVPARGRRVDRKDLRMSAADKASSGRLRQVMSAGAAVFLADDVA